MVYLEATCFRRSIPKRLLDMHSGGWRLTQWPRRIWKKINMIQARWESLNTVGSVRPQASASIFQTNQQQKLTFTKTSVLSDLPQPQSFKWTTQSFLRIQTLNYSDYQKNQAVIAKLSLRLTSIKRVRIHVLATSSATKPSRNLRKTLSTPINNQVRNQRSWMI